MWRFVKHVGMIVPILAVSACNPVEDLSKGSLGDVQAPMLVSQEVDRDGHVELSFDEDVDLDANSLKSDASSPPVAAEPKNKAKGKRVVAVDTTKGSTPGKAYSMAAGVKDKSGNTTRVVVPYFGANTRLPKVLINEVLTKSSTTMRDAVELYVQSDGNLAGLTLLSGIPEDSDSSYTFKSLEVQAGDYLVVHFKPEGGAGEVDEYDSPSASSGRNVSALARDFWVLEGKGIPDANGVLVLCENPLGKALDAVFWSDKTTQEGKEGDAFGTKKLKERVAFLSKVGAWKGSGKVLQVEDAVRSDKLTATRSLCRSESITDSDKASDWHTVPSGKSSLGARNTDEVLP